MKQILKNLRLVAAGLTLAVGLVYGFSAPVAAQAGAAKTAVCAGVNNATGTCTGGGPEITKVVKSVIQILSVIAGIAAVIMLIIGGLRYITAGGDASGTASAKSTIIYALVGLVVVAFAQIIVRYVLGKATTP
jgi:hypothetical protein